MMNTNKVIGNILGGKKKIQLLRDGKSRNMIDYMDILNEYAFQLYGRSYNNLTVQEQGQVQYTVRQAGNDVGQIEDQGQQQSGWI